MIVKASLMRPGILLLAVLMSWPCHAQPAQNPLSFVQTGNWPEAQAAAARLGDPAAAKLIRWYRILAPNTASATEIATFARQNPDWPLPTLTERRRQEAIAAERDDPTAAALCLDKKPVLGSALQRCAEALAAQPKTAETLAKEAWITAIADPATEAAFLRRFPALITPQDQWTRFLRLAWTDTDADAARRQIAFLDPARAAQAIARLGLKSNAIGYSANPSEDPGAMLDLARLYRRANQNASAVALWRSAGDGAQKAAPDRMELFWSERHQLARKLIREGDPAGAYAILATHGQTIPANAVEAEFLAGFLALRRLNDPTAAARHFSALAAASPATLTQSRAFYWLARAKLAAGADAHADFARAAAFPMTFYGQLAARAGALSDAALIQSLRAAPIPAATAQTAITAELAHNVQLLLAWGDPRRARVFLIRMDEIARTPAERIGTGDFATSLGLPDIAVTIARRLGRDGVTPPMQGWPMPFEPPATLEPAISLAIMRQESNFDLAIVSPAGARGLMQLMPATAQAVARRTGDINNTAALTVDPALNMRLGTAYLLEVLQKFDNALPMAAAAYNAGPHRVSQWLTENGDPRVGDASMIDWIEMIPFNETRNYVQRVLENAVIYQARRAGTLPVSMPQWSR